MTNESLLAQSIEEVIAKFQHAVVQNQLAELIHHFNQYEDVVEKELFDIVQEEIEIAIDDDKAHADILRKVLFGPTITVKALLSMRMENKVKKYLNTELDNPIKKRCSTWRESTLIYLKLNIMPKYFKLYLSVNRFILPCSEMCCRR